MAAGWAAAAVTVAEDVAAGTPFVVLCGWVNSQDKYLAKYSALLAAHGYSSLRTIQPTATGFALLESGRRKWAASILSFVSESKHCTDRPVVLWVFSNGGCWVFEQTCLLLEQDSQFAELKPRISGLIFDSCPADMTLSSGAKAFSSGASLPMALVLRLTFFVLAAAGMLVVGNYPKRFWQRLMDEKVPAPRLYLYSADDDLCDATHLEHLIEHKQAQGLNVTVQHWQQSSHCAHLRRHPAEYTAAVMAFLKKVSAAGS